VPLQVIHLFLVCAHIFTVPYFVGLYSAFKLVTYIDRKKTFSESSAGTAKKPAEDNFQIEGAVAIEFDAAKNQMTAKRRGGGRFLPILQSIASARRRSV